MYLYTLKQHEATKLEEVAVVNRFKKNVSLHVETTKMLSQNTEISCESL